MLQTFTLFASDCAGSKGGLVARGAAGRRLVLLLAVLCVVCGGPAWAGWASVTVRPTNATVNSIWDTAAVWTPEADELASTAGVYVDGRFQCPAFPYRIVNPADGSVEYRASVSAGLNMSYPSQQPDYVYPPDPADPYSDANNPCLLRSPYWDDFYCYPNGLPMGYAPRLISNGPPTQREISYGAWVTYNPVNRSVLLGTFTVTAPDVGTYVDGVIAAFPSLPFLRVVENDIGPAAIQVTVAVVDSDGTPTTATATIPAGAVVDTDIPLTVETGNPVSDATGCTIEGGTAGDKFEIRVVELAFFPSGGGGTVTVYNSSMWYQTDDTVDYGGFANRDYLEAYPGPNWPQMIPPDPLTPVRPSPIVPSNATTPDDGSSSDTYEFRVVYVNRDNQPPKPWFRAWADEFDPPGGRRVIPDARLDPTGVVLYLDYMDVFDLSSEHRQEGYRPHFMRPEDPADANYAAGVVYYYRLQPCQTWMFQGPPYFYPPTPRLSNEYVALMAGTYHYFYGCSDDHLYWTLPSGATVYLGEMQPDGWGQTTSLERHETRSSIMLDPSLERNLTDRYGQPFMPRPEGRRYSAFGNTLDPFEPKDWTIYVDRENLCPGRFELNYFFQYPWPATEHPIVTDALAGFGSEQLDGYGRFMGTIQPFYRAVNPQIVTPLTPIGFGYQANRAETCGATTSTVLTFRTKYYQIDGKPPVWIKTFVNNASIKIINPNQPLAPENGGYVAYTMQPSATQTSPGQSQVPPYDYKIGVDYEFKTQLPPGPHTYFFMAFDGSHHVLFPARPDDWAYVLTYGEYFVPGYRPGDPQGLDNNYFPGPYVNHACELSSPSVTPATGTQGGNYVYRVIYKDADGQRPFRASIYIETGNPELGDNGVIRADMVKENPTDSDYVRGVTYVLNTATLENFSLALGVRHYRFEFIDDWGRQNDPNDLLQGETTRLPVNAGWIEGPTIAENARPTLRNGKAVSTDGTSNTATVWTFRVMYKDINNDPPKYVTVYLGRLSENGESIEWDAGHQMAQVDPADTVYSDGVDYSFQTRLEGAENPGDHEPLYYYAFEASDGVNLAVWVPEDYADEEARSESAGCMLKDTLTTSDQLVYQSSKKGSSDPATDHPLVGTLPSQPVDVGILIDPVVWRYPGGDLTSPTVVSREDDYVARGIDVNPLTVARYDREDPAYQPAISEVLGVYATSDMAGIDYFHSEDGTLEGTYDPASGYITLVRPVPAGTNWLWIKYHHRPMLTLGQFVVTGSDTGDFTPGVIVDAAYALYPDIRVMNGPIGAEDIAVTVSLIDVNGDLTTGTCTIPAGSPAGTRIPVQVANGNKVTAATGCTIVGGTAGDSFEFQIADATKPAYRLNRMTGEFAFEVEQPAEDVLQADYLFGTLLNSRIGANQLPMLMDAKLLPRIGSSNQDFIYTVLYKEIEGLNGQAPTFVRVVIDGIPHAMAPTVGGTPSYRAGVTYRYIAKLASGSHNYYFETSDGVGLVTLPLTNVVTGRIDPLLGPWVNDPPALRNGTADPNPPGGTISAQQPVVYSVVFSDPDNDPPIVYKPFANDTTVTNDIRNMEFFTPLLYVDNLDETWYVGSIESLVPDPAQPSKHRAIRVLDATGQTPSFTANQFAGKLIQIMSGSLAGRVYLIGDNTADTLKLVIDDLVTEGVEPGMTYSIATLGMFKADTSQQNYNAGVAYALTIPQLAEGQHKFHFKAASVMIPPTWVGPPESAITQSAWVRLPTSGEYNGPNVIATPPSTNRAPVLSMPSGDNPVSPGSGLTTDLYTFYVTYRDDDGDPPRLHDGNVPGYIRVVFNDGTFAADMRPEVPETGTDFYQTPRRFLITANGLPGGPHKFHFEASDGWVPVRWPALVPGTDPTAGDPIVSVNSKAQLSGIIISPPSGNISTTFDISVTYSDLDGLGPFVESGREQVWVEIGDPTNKVYLTRNPSDTKFATGVVYRGQKAQLASGTHATVFKARDNGGELTTKNGPAIQVSENINAPTLADAQVFNLSRPSEINEAASGSTSDTFRYKVIYRDADGNMPIVERNGSVVEGIELYIDGKLEAVLGQAQRVGDNFAAGVIYQYDRPGTKYQSGSHNYRFKAKDDLLDVDHAVQTALIQGPTIISATITMVRETYDVATQSWVGRDPRVTETMRITGVLIGTPSKPIPPNQNFTITVAKPDGTGETFTTTGTSDNHFTLERVPTINKTWTITARWDGNADYKPATVQDLKVDVKGYTRVVATQDMSRPSESDPAIDMVTMPAIAPNRDAGTLFGFDRANLTKIVRWDAVQRTWLYYGQTYFPPLDAGYAVWIYPNRQYPAESIDTVSPPYAADPDFPVNPSLQYRLLKPFGNLWDQKTDCAVAVRTGWNQIGSPFLLPVDLSSVKVGYQGKTLSIDEAAARGWVRSYVWLWHPTQQEYKLIHSTRPDAYLRTIDPWRGYWLRAFVDCVVIIPAPSGRAGDSAAAAAAGAAREDLGPTSGAALPPVDAPPPAPGSAAK